MRQWQRGEISYEWLQSRSMSLHYRNLTFEAGLQMAQLRAMLADSEAILEQGSTGPVRRANLQAVLRDFNSCSLRRAVTNLQDCGLYAMPHINANTGAEVARAHRRSMRENIMFPY